MVNSSIALLGNSFSNCPVIKSKPGALWLAHFLISSLTSDGEKGLTLILLTWRIGWAPNNASRWEIGYNSACKGLIGRVIGHALPKDVLTIFSKLLVLFVCGVVNTLERYSAKAVAFSVSVFPQLPSSCRIGGTWVIGFLNRLVAFQRVWSSFDKVLMCLKCRVSCVLKSRF